MKITIEPEPGDTIESDDPKLIEEFAKPVIIEHVFEFCLVGTCAMPWGTSAVRRLHSNINVGVFDLVGLLEAEKQRLLSLAHREVPHKQIDPSADVLTAGVTGIDPTADCLTPRTAEKD